MEVIIKNKSQSFEQIVIDLNVYLRSLPDWASWQDYFKTGSGQTIIELIAGLGTQLFYFINIQRQENYLQTAMNRSSVIGIAQMLGYSAGRGNAVKARITVTPNQTGVFNKFTVIGQCKGVDMIMEESVLLNEGEQKSFNIIIGTLKRDYCKINSSALQPFRMTKPNISEDYILYKAPNNYTDNELTTICNNIDFDKSGWIELPTSSKMRDMINDKYIVQTNVLSAVDIFYLNEGSSTRAYPYKQEEVLFLDYVELSDTEFSITDLDFYYGDVDSVDSVASYNAVETINSIKVNAPLANETQALLRARDDGEKLVQEFGKNYISAVNSRDISSEVIEVTYIKNDFTLLSALEYEELYDYLYNQVRPFGIDMPYISPPIRALLDLEIEVELSNPLVKNTVMGSIQSMVESLEGTFIVDTEGNQTQLDLDLIEKQIEDIYGVKLTRVYVKSSVFNSNDLYRIGEFVRSTSSSTGCLYKLERIIHKSGNIEPSWSTHVGDYIIDNQIRWVCKKQVFGKGSTWSADTSYQTSDIVLPSVENGCMYVFDSYIGTSGQSEPPAAEDSTTYDNNLVWFKIDKNASAKAWEADTLYAMGAIVDLSSDENSSYQMIGFRDKAGTTPAIWPTPESDNREIQIGNLVFKCYNSIDSKGNYKNPMLDYDWNQYLHVNYSLSIAE